MSPFDPKLTLRIPSHQLTRITHQQGQGIEISAAEIKRFAILEKLSIDRIKCKCAKTEIARSHDFSDSSHFSHAAHERPRHNCSLLLKEGLMAMESKARGSRIPVWRIVGWGALVVVLAVPFVAMQFTDEVKWNASDFMFAGVMFGTVGLLIELAVRRTSNWAYRGGVFAAALAGLLIIWANGAVGMIGSEANAYNLLFVAPILVALGGSIAARFRSAGMAWTMLAAAAVHIAVAIGGIPVDPRGVVFSMLLSAFWLMAAALFHGVHERRSER